MEVWGTLDDGRDVHRITLQQGEFKAHVLTLGAIVQDLRWSPHPFPLVLGSEQLSDYLGPMRYFGAMVGRFANRLGHGQFTLNGQHHQVSQNEKHRHCLHGGTQGSGTRLWTVSELWPNKVALVLTQDDGDMGFPGTLNTRVCISLQDQALRFEISATSDQDTLCNFTHHGFFCLDDTNTIAQHELQLLAPRVLDIDDDLIPTGLLNTVAGTAFDFTVPRSLGGQALDHHFCLAQSRQPIRPVAWLRSRVSNIELQVETTETGIQVYTADHIAESGWLGLDGRHYRPQSGLALETQAWPDAPNHAHFPSAVLRAGDTYHAQACYRFSQLEP